MTTQKHEAGLPTSTLLTHADTDCTGEEARKRRVRERAMKTSDSGVSGERIWRRDKRE